VSYDRLEVAITTPQQGPPTTDHDACCALTIRKGDVSVWLWVSRDDLEQIATKAAFAHQDTDPNLEAHGDD